jgi:hypothetical protein
MSTVSWWLPLWAFRPFGWTRHDSTPALTAGRRLAFPFPFATSRISGSSRLISTRDFHVASPVDFIIALVLSAVACTAQLGHLACPPAASTLARLWSTDHSPSFPLFFLHLDNSWLAGLSVHPVRLHSFDSSFYYSTTISIPSVSFSRALSTTRALFQSCDFCLSRHPPFAEIESSGITCSESTRRTHGPTTASSRFPPEGPHNPEVGRD